MEGEFCSERGREANQELALELTGHQGWGG